jgi:mutual gliding-motility protein MglA
MAVINHATREVTFKIVYCGTPMGGKTSNLQYIHSRIDTAQRGDLVSLATSTDRTLYFDFLPINTVAINGYSTKFMLYTVPGQVCYNATRQLVLRGVDGIIFVADSLPDSMHANLQSMRSLAKNLVDNGTPMESLPMILQYNKRDVPNAVATSYLEYLLNNYAQKRQSFEACATTGWQVFATLNAIASEILHRFNEATKPRETRPPAAPSVTTKPQTAERHLTPV